MLLDLEDLDVALRDRLAGARSDCDGDQPQDLLWLFPGVEHGPLVGADDEDRILELLVSQKVNGVGMVVQAHLGVRQVREGQPRQLEPSLGIEHRRLVSGARSHEDEQAIGAELAQRSFRQRNMSQVRRIERAAEDRRRQSVTVSSPISTSAPGLAPTARSASSSASRSGGFPTIRNPRSVRKMRYAPRPSGCGR